MSSSLRMQVNIMAFTFEKKVIYLKALKFAERIVEMLVACPPEYKTISDQMTKSAVAIAAHIAEAGCWSNKTDRREFFIMARSRVQESAVLLDLAERRSIIGEKQQKFMKKLLEEVARMISGQIG